MPIPNTNRLTDRVVTSVETWKSIDVGTSANEAYMETLRNCLRQVMKATGHTIEEEPVTQMTPALRMITVSHFLHNGRDVGVSLGSRCTSYWESSVFWSSEVVSIRSMSVFSFISSEENF